MNTLILTEKPSVAKDFAKALGIKSRGDGFVEGNGYIITWAVGHLVELAEPEEYDEKWKRWSLRSLPILPEGLKYKPIPKVSKQLKTIQKLVKRQDVGSVVIATDAGREGEVIARTILGTVNDTGCEILRFWTSQALTPQVVQETLARLRPASEYDRLWHAGQARQAADWLVGMNLTRAATLQMGRPRDLYSIGRVQTAVLALLVDRKKERDDFEPMPYWLLRANFTNPDDEKQTWRGTWFKGEVSRFEKKEEAERVFMLVEGRRGKVKSVRREKKKQAPPMLYSLTDLQRDANIRFGLSAKQTLDIAQRLYEDKKCLSYPRTDARVLGSQNVGLVKGLVAKLSSVTPELFQGVDQKRISASYKRVFDDAKLTDHHALIPLAPLPPGAVQNEQKIYDLVLRRFAAAFHPDYEYEATVIVTEIEGETFRTRGTRPLVPGWKAVHEWRDVSPGESGDELEETDLPLLEKGSPAKVEALELEEKMTQPPPEYTEALLLKDMTNPSRYVSEEELRRIFKGEVGLGTQATRAQIIETLLNRRYVVRQKKKLLPTEKGSLLIHSVRRFQKARAIATPEETARWEMELERIARGAGDPHAFMAGIRAFVRDCVEEFKMGGLQRTNQEAGQEPLGQCPACGGNVVEGKKGYGCANWREQDGGCRFVIWKEIAGQTIQREMVPVLLSGEVTPAMEFRSRGGKEFSAALKLEHDEQQGKWLTRFIFSGQNKNPGGEASESGAPRGAALGTCPRCGGEVIEGSKGYGCKNWRKEDGGCSFVVWKQIAGKRITLEILRDLLERGETEVLNGFVSKKGSQFSAKLRLEGEDYKPTFVF